ncbi:hypothetical protein [Helcococcus kunzii]|uniref:hypothetical protein n=1 Tax=Helcococcus kunzii TaxID=40091 RepID=UPI0024ADF616|nr:hypothetical protein [Helcococcus kunzii]
MLIKKIKKIICIMMVVLLGFNSSGFVLAHNEEKESLYINKNNKELQEVLDVIIRVGNHLIFDEDGQLIVNISDQELTQKYNLSFLQLDRLYEIINLKNEKVITKNEEKITLKRAPDNYIGRFYLDHISLTTGTLASLGAAAYAGPGALAAAWTALSTAAAGPIGTIGGAISGILGTAFFADLALKIVGAIESGKGIAIYTLWAFPPVQVAIE